MSAKNRDKYGRWRSLTIGFKVTPATEKMICTMAKLSGLNKQDFFVNRMFCHRFDFVSNPRLFKQLEPIVQQIIERTNEVKNKSSHAVWSSR